MSDAFQPHEVLVETNSTLLKVMEMGKGDGM